MSLGRRRGRRYRCGLARQLPRFWGRGVRLRFLAGIAVLTAACGTGTHGSTSTTPRLAISAGICSAASAGCGSSIPTASPAPHSPGAATTPSPSALPAAAAGADQWSDFSGGSWVEQGGHLYASQSSGAQWTDVTPHVCPTCSVTADTFLSAQDAVYAAVGSASQAASAAGGADRVWVAGYRTGGGA